MENGAGLIETGKEDVVGSNGYNVMIYCLSLGGAK